MLNEDGYSLFNYGHLAPCVWSDAEQEIEGTGRCPELVRSKFHDFLSNTTAAERDVVISDEWLSEPSSEIGLQIVLNSFEPVIVIYYRRFFDWLLSSYYEWHTDIEISTVQAMKGKVRLIDFIRLLCNDLFDSENHHSGGRLVGLVDFPDYTYSLWERYTKVPVYKDNVKIVNFHDGHAVKSFYCDVLHAEKSCKLEASRLKVGKSEDFKTEPTASTLVEVSMGLNSGNSVISSKKRFNELGDWYAEKMAVRGLSEADFPKECLSHAETSMLLAVSLEYERILLPTHFSSGGEDELRQQFESLNSDVFCSVDLERVAESSKWHFLLEP